MTEPASITFKKFLESCPEKKLQKVSEMYYSDNRRWIKNSPVLNLYCEECNGMRNFEGEWLYGDTAHDETERSFLIYTCCNCNIQEKTYCLLMKKMGSGYGNVVKVGEYPNSYSDIPKSLKKILGTDYSIFIKGLKCENLGLGIGALTYYRRLVELQKDHLFSEILEAAKKLNAPETAIKRLEEATTIREFSRAVEMAKNAIPESLLVDNHNPMKLLYKAMSIGVHEADDNRCLDIAQSIRMVLSNLSINIQAALKDQSAVKSAISKLLSFNGKPKKES